MKRTVIYIATDGTSAIDLSTVASATDMVITSEPYRRGDGRNMDKLTIDAPVVGEISTEKQRDAVNRWVTNWLEKRTKLFGKTVEESARIKTEVRKEKDGDDPDKIWEIPSITVEVPYGKLSSEQKEIYDAIYMLAEDPTNIDNVAVVEVKTTLDNTYYQNTIAPAYFALLYDHPELFWLYANVDNHLVFGSLEQNGKTLLYLGYDEPYKNYETDMKAFNQAAADFLKDINLKGSNIEIADAIHDKLIDLVVYDDYVAKNQVSADLAHSAYGALVANSRGDKNTCVCDGYSLAYVYLCQQAGLDAVFLCGMAGANEQEAGGHAWSMVSIDGKWKEVDSCWDDWDDMFELLLKEFGSKSDGDSRKIVEAASNEDFQKSVEHYLDRVSTDYITKFNDVESFVYPFDDGTAFVILSESVHVRMDKVNSGGADAALMKLAPIAE